MSNVKKENIKSDIVSKYSIYLDFNIKEFHKSICDELNCFGSCSIKVENIENINKINLFKLIKNQKTNKWILNKLNNIEYK